MQPEINLFPPEIIDRLNIWPSQDMKLLIVELRDVSQVLFDPWKGRITFDFIEYVGLYDAEIDTASEDDILGILQCPGPGDRQKAQAVLFSRKTECQIDRVVGSFRDDAEETRVYLFAHRVTPLDCRVHPMHH